MENLLVRRVSWSTDRSLRLGGREILDVRQNTGVLVLDAANWSDVGRNAGIDEDVVKAGILSNWDSV